VSTPFSVHTISSDAAHAAGRRRQSHPQARPPLASRRARHRVSPSYSPLPTIARLSPLRTSHPVRLAADSVTTATMATTTAVAAAAAAHAVLAAGTTGVPHRAEKNAVPQNSCLRTITPPACPPDERLPAATAAPPSGTCQAARRSERTPSSKAACRGSVPPSQGGRRGRAPPSQGGRHGSAPPCEAACRAEGAPPRQGACRGRAPAIPAARRARARRPPRLPAVRGRAAYRGCPPRGGAAPRQTARRAASGRPARAPAARARRPARLPAVPGAHRSARAPAVRTATVADSYRACRRGRGHAPPRARLPHRNAFVPHRNAFRSASLESQGSNIIYQRGLSTEPN